MIRVSSKAVRRALFVAVALLSGCNWSGDSEQDNTSDALSVIFVIPSPQTNDPNTEVPKASIDTPVSIAFSRMMNVDSFTSSNFLVTGGGQPVCGTISPLVSPPAYPNGFMVFQPEMDLSFDTAHTITVKAGVQAVDGTPLAADYISSFVTESAPGPIVRSTIPANNDTGVSLTSSIIAFFSVPMAPASFTAATFTVAVSSGGRISGTVSYADGLATFTPDAPLQPNRTYTATIAAGVRAADAEGGVMAAPYSWNFITAGGAASLQSAAPSAARSVARAAQLITDDARPVAVQHDCKTITVGYLLGTASKHFAVARYNLEGGLDTGFGNNGIVTTPVGTSDAQARAAAVQPGGRIVVAGESSNGIDTDMAVVRYNPDGSLDATFGAGGKVITPGAGNERAVAVAIQPDGKIIVAGTVDSGTVLVLARYNENGSPDASFGKLGIVNRVANASNEASYAMALQADGSLVVARRVITESKVTLTRYAEGGNSTIGMLPVSFPAPASGSTLRINAAVIDTGGKISPVGSDSATIIAAAAPTVVITEDANNDGHISSSELRADIGVRIGLPAGAAAGDTVRVSAGTRVNDIVLGVTDITAGAVTDEIPPPSGGSITVTAEVIGATTSPAGSDHATVAITGAAKALAVTITTDINNDGVISNDELALAGGVIGARIDLPADAAAGDTVRVSSGVSDPTTTTSIVLIAADITAGSVTHSFSPPPPVGSTFTVSAMMGNVSPVVRDSAAIETLATVAAPVVTIIEDTNNDGIISSGELAGVVDVNIGLPAGVVIGDVVRVSDGLTTVNTALTAVHFDPPASETVIDLTAQQSTGKLMLAVMASGRMVLVRSAGVGSAAQFTLLRYFP